MGRPRLKNVVVRIVKTVVESYLVRCADRQDPRDCIAGEPFDVSVRSVAPYSEWEVDDQADEIRFMENRPGGCHGAE